MFGVKDMIHMNDKEKMKGVLMNQASPYVNRGFEDTMNPCNTHMGLEYSVLKAGPISGDFDSVENFMSSSSSSSSSLNFMHPFNSSMHQGTQMSYIDRGMVKNPNVQSLPSVQYEVGLCENLQGMHIGDKYNSFCNNTAGFHVEQPDGFLTGYNGPFSESFGGFDIYGFDEYLNKFEEGHHVKDSRETLPFSSYSNAIGKREKVDYYDYNMMQRKEQGRGYFDSGLQFQNPSVMNDTHFKPEPNNRSYTRGFSSSQLIGPAIECDTIYDFQQMQKKGGRIQCYEADFYQSLSCVPKAEEVHVLSCEKNFIVDGKCRKGSKNKSGDVIMMNRSHKVKPVSDNISNSGKKLASGLGHDEHDSAQGNTCAEVQVMHRYLGEMKGYICMVAKHQLGCRFLQRVFDEGSSEDAQAIFREVIDNVLELVLDPFGNYLIQKMLESCTEEQKLRIVLAITKRRGELVGICSSPHGTRVVQKLIETIKSKQQISLVMIALKPGLVELMKDPNGNHVVQRCLQYHTNEQNKFIFDTAAKFCIDIACDRFGCCVVNRCIAYSSGVHREKFVVSIAGHGLLLAQNDFGNYVIQQIIELKIPSSIVTLLSQFEGHYVQLSMQKFSSHVIEKCLRCIKESRYRITKELLSVRHFDQLLQDRFANYVIQAALQVTKGSPSLHAILVQAIRPYQSLRSSPYCKNIFTRNH